MCCLYFMLYLWYFIDYVIIFLDHEGHDPFLCLDMLVIGLFFNDLIYFWIMDIMIDG